LSPPLCGASVGDTLPSLLTTVNPTSAVPIDATRLCAVVSGDGRVSINSPVGMSLIEDGGAVISEGSVVVTVVDTAAAGEDKRQRVKSLWEWWKWMRVWSEVGAGEVMVVKIKMVVSAASPRDASVLRNSNRSTRRGSSIADPDLTAVRRAVLYALCSDDG
jgi:hypothetical protein